MALILVLISHGFFFTNRVNGVGRIGVNLFFFISGILVYRSLNREKGSWSAYATSFWWRRFRRLYPALIAYALVMLVATVFLQHIPNLPERSDFRSYLLALPAALTYSVNYAHNYTPSLQQLWSLACEMQFYLLAPVIFLLGRGSRRRGLFVFGFICLLLAGMGLIYPLRVAHYEPVKYHFEIAVWPMMLGFFCEFAKSWFLRIPRGVVKIVFGIGVAALLASMIVMPFGMEMKKVVIAMGALLLFPCLLGYLFELPFPGMVGNSLAWIGERTYSIYLWQQPLTVCNFLPFALHPAGAAVSVLVGAFWFNIFEKPFLTTNRVRQLVTAPISHPLDGIAAPNPRALRLDGDLSPD